MTDKDWLQKLKAGDEVAIVTVGWTRTYKFAEVTRTTATQIIVGSTRFRRENGREVGAQYRGDFLQPATDELKAGVAQEAKRRDLIYRLDNIKWRNHSDEVLEAVTAILDKA